MTEHLLDGDWLVIEIDGETVDPDAPRAVRFEGDRVAGRVGVNRFIGSFTMDGEVLQLGRLAVTRMAGLPEMMPWRIASTRLSREIFRSGWMKTSWSWASTQLCSHVPRRSRFEGRWATGSVSGCHPTAS